jgi:hypothetical protein
LFKDLNIEKKKTEEETIFFKEGINKAHKILKEKIKHLSKAEQNILRRTPGAFHFYYLAKDLFEE